MGEKKRYKTGIVIEDEWERARKKCIEDRKREEGEKERGCGREGGARFDSLRGSPCRYSVCL